MPREISMERLVRDAKRVLENPFTIPGLDPEVVYHRLHDDHDGTNEGTLMVQLERDGDMRVAIQPSGINLRFRTDFGGGGKSLRTRNALMLLAWAIQEDNKENGGAS